MKTFKNKEWNNFVKLKWLWQEFVAKAIYLFLLIAELGDFQPDVHDPDLVSEFMLYPNQDERMEADIFERFKELR